MDHLRLLTSLQAHDAALWGEPVSVETAYVQQALRYLTRAIEGDWSFQKALAEIEGMMP